jgi:GntR family transcriptional regulator/MocR family aminotransferase
MNTAHFPLAVWKKCTDRLLSVGQSTCLNYSDPQGEPQLRELLAVYLYQARGVRRRPEQIMIAIGTKIVPKMIYRPITWKYRAPTMENPGERRPPFAARASYPLAAGPSRRKKRPRSKH